MIQNAQEGFNLEEKTLAIFFDVAAAFDKVWYGGLIYKLNSLRVPYYILRIIIVFLDGRTFSVKVNGRVSDVFNILCGVPQGGVLSPTLFAFYINDVPLALDNDEITILFADDIAYLKRFKYKDKKSSQLELKKKAQDSAQNFLNRLEEWMSDWHLSLAPKNCAQITFSKAKDLKK